MTHVHVVIRGGVQGVGYRFATRAQARRIGVTGWVRNRSDGAVEAQLEGAPESVDALLAWMEHGPAGATVDAIEVTAAAPTGARSFEILRTA